LLKVGDAPVRLLRAVRGLDLVELPAADQCCGFGGTFAVKNAEVSMAMLDDKLSAIERSGAEAVTAVDNSCLMQIGGGLSRRGSPVRTVHLAEILAAT
jgi:L-lactate dehydrogenase complex protein LldE